MAVHLVTGFKGEEHIQSADQGSFNASFFGEGEFVMEAGNQCDASILDNNTVRVLDGDILMQGRHIRIPSDTYIDVTIQTGTAGVNRNDMIVMEYRKDAGTGIETADLKVIKGVSAEGTAIDPTYTAGDILAGDSLSQMPLYRVKVEGVVLSAVEPMFTTIPSYKALAEKYAKEFQQACESHLDSLNILDTMEEVEANTQENQLAGALALKELSLSVSDAVKKISDTEATTEELNALVGIKGNIQKQFDDLEGFAHGTSIHVDNSKEAPAIVIPYGNTIQDGEPTPDVPIEIENVVLSEIKTCKKNLFKCTSFSNGTQNGVTLQGYLNEQGFLEYFTLDGTCTNAIYRSLTLPNMTLPKGSYVLNGCPNGGSNTTYRWYISTTDGKTYIDEGKGVSFTFEENTTLTLTLVIYKGAVCNNVKFYPMISVEGGEFEPYTESVATLSNPITLNGLNGVQDTLENKKFKEVVFNGSESGWTMAADGTFRLTLNGYKNRDRNTLNYMSNLLRAVTVNEYTSVSGGIDNSFIVTDNALMLCKTTAFSTLDDWKAHLASKPMEVTYELAEPIETPLPEADVEALRALQSFDGITNVFNDANAEMDFIYATNKHSAITMENNKELHKCLQIVSFDAETGTLITKSVDYTE